MENNPSFDVVVTEHRPLLSVFNSKGGVGKRSYTMQLDTVDSFDSKDFIQYTNIPEETAYVTGYRVQCGNELKDGRHYYWRVRSTDEAGNNSGWGQTRFYVDTESDKHFMKMVRVPVKEVSVSSGFYSIIIISVVSLFCDCLELSSFRRFFLYFLSYSLCCAR